jgi:hypothetical protein
MFGRIKLIPLFKLTIKEEFLNIQLFLAGTNPTGSCRYHYDTDIPTYQFVKEVNSYSPTQFTPSPLQPGKQVQK